MPKYETMLITSATLDEEATTTLVDKFKKLIEANGTIDAVDEWGKRRLAYPINKENDGTYTLIHFTSEPDFPAELDRVYKITDGVLRTLIIAKEEGAELPAKAEEKPAAAEEKPAVAAEENPAVAEEKPAVAEQAAEPAAPAPQEATQEEQ